MERAYVNMDNIRFLLYEVHRIEELFQYQRYSHLSSREEIDMLLDAAKDIADKELFPYFKDMDANPVVFQDAKVISHPQLANVIRAIADAGWIGGTSNFDHGGMQLPEMISSSAHFVFQSANNSAQGYTGLTLGAANLITAFGSQTLIDTYIPKMYAGEWQGTMALTEPQAGSSLSDIVTSAEPNSDGSYNISGQKIFISGGEHLACNNFVHLTLARIKGAPVGTKGISLFLIPKFLPEENLAFNNVACVGDFQKLGQKGYATTHLAFGDAGPCKGFLLGEANQGLSYMFQMMNEARIMVGQTAAAVASAAYYASLHYAQERPQGRKIEDKDPAKQQTLIINHADVRRMLLLQKAIFEGAMSLGLECLRLVDLHKAAEDHENMDDQLLLLELLTPIMKTYPSEMGIESVSNALQVLGGYGYTMDFDLQQYYRDIRIMAIYEGTTGIQSIDLLGHKMIMKNGKGAKLLIDQMQSTMDQASSYETLKPYIMQLGEGISSLVEVMEFLKLMLEEGEVERFLADANIFMELASNLVIAWQWLKQGVVAHQQLLKNEGEQMQADFYESKVHTMKFYFKYELPKLYANAATLMNTEELTIKHGKEVLN